MNMLSAKKVKLHGMSSTRWTIKDQATQYKGLLNLYNRDRKISQFDSNVQRKKQHTEWKQTTKEIDNNRTAFRNVIQGDRQKVRNTLADNRTLQLAYQDLHPTKIISHLHQDNFNKRKELDRIIYQKKQKSQKLKTLKLEVGQLEDIIKYEGPGQIPIERTAQIITGKVQDTILKREAASGVRITYRNILSILKKDSLYFDAVLNSIQGDGYNQRICMIRTTQLGQLATEYLDDRRQEYAHLEMAVIRDMKTRDVDLDLVQGQADELHQNMKNLIRRDSDINICRVKVPLTKDFVSLENDVMNIEELLRFLKNVTFVSNFEDIYSCIQEQKRQKENLEMFFQTNIGVRDVLLNKTNHGELRHMYLLHTMNETTFEYKAEKKQLKASIEQQKERKKELKETIVQRCNLLVDIRACILHMVQMCRHLPSKPAGAGEKVTQQLAMTLKILTSKAIDKPLTSEEMEVAHKFCHQLAVDTSSGADFHDEKFTEDALIEVVLEDAKVPTRLEIKSRSKKMVAENTANDDLIPVFAPTTKKRTYLKK